MEQDSFTILPTPESEKIKERYIKDFIAQNPLIDIYDHEGNLVHPSRLSALEARVKQQADEIEILKGSLDLVIAKVGKLSAREMQREDNVASLGSKFIDYIEEIQRVSGVKLSHEAIMDYWLNWDRLSKNG